jgi:carbonic anhydrase
MKHISLAFASLAIFASVAWSGNPNTTADRQEQISTTAKQHNDNNGIEGKTEEAVITKNLDRLKSGNARFVSGKLSNKNFARERKDLVTGQQPYAIILCCSDSRVSPELLFDESLGQLFIVRDAGNVADSVTLGSVEYAAEHLHSKLLVVLGHTSCGAVKATLTGGEVPPNIGAIARRIAPAANRAKAKHLDEKGTARDASIENVRQQIDACSEQSSVLRELIEKHELKVVGALYNLETGKVEFQ